MKKVVIGLLIGTTAFVLLALLLMWIGFNDLITGAIAGSLSSSIVNVYIIISEK
jgi:hypothetical protein